MKNLNKTSLFNKKLALQAAKDSFIKLNPVSLIKNPVIFIVAIGSFLTTIVVIAGIFEGSFSAFNLQIAIWEIKIFIIFKKQYIRINIFIIWSHI